MRFKLVGGLVLAAFGVIYALAGYTGIEPGEVGVVVKNLGKDRGMQDYTWDTGAHWADPFVFDAIVYDTRLKQYSLVGANAVQANTADGQPVRVDVSFEIGLVDAGVPNLHENVGVNYYEQVVLPLARSTLRNATAKLLSDEIYTGAGRIAIQTDIDATLQAELSPLGIRIETNLRDITFLNADFVDTLEEKAIAAQQEEIKRREAAAAEQEAFRVQNVAQGQRFKVIEEATAERERLRLQGEGLRLRDEEAAMGILAIATANAEGRRLMNVALSGPGGSLIRDIEVLGGLGQNVEFYGVPTGAAGTSTYIIAEALAGKFALPSGN